MEFNLNNDIYLQITKSILSAIKKAGFNLELPESEIYNSLSRPPKADMGDLAFPCFPLAKPLKMGPPQIANKLQENIETDGLIQEAKVFGPYLNFYLNLEKINYMVLEETNTGKLFQKKLVSNSPKTIIEFSQPNTHKILHVGHMRNLCLGNAIVNLYRFAGIETLSTTFPGDVGTHVAKCLWYYKHHNQEPIPKERKGAWIGEMYTKGNNLLEEQRGSEREEENRKILTQILKELHAKQGEYYELWLETRKWSISLMQDVYKWAKVEFDSWYWESDVDADSVALIQQKYNEGLFVKDDGAIGMDLKEDKLGFCLLLKSDGTGLYATKDIELARRKFEDHGVEKSLYIVDNRQALHFKQVFKTLEKMGFEHAKDCFHLQYEMVELTDGAMSSRKGNIVALQTLIDNMVSAVKTQHLEKYKGDWEDEKISIVANQVASGAIKYGMNKIDANKKIIFDMNEWLKLDGDSGPYIQYVYARIQSMVKKLELKNDPTNAKLLIHDLEKQLILKINEFNEVIQVCIEQNKTHPLCSYLYELAKGFNSFYAECSLANAETTELKQARGSLCHGVARTLKKGLGILGIEAPEQM